MLARKSKRQNLPRSVWVGEILTASSVTPSVLLWPEWSRAALGAESGARHDEGAASPMGTDQNERSREVMGASLRSSDLALGVSVTSRWSSVPGSASADFSSGCSGE